MINHWTEEAIKEFWASMGEIYGRRFFFEFGESPNSKWINALNRMTPDQVRMTLSDLFREGKDKPPTLPRFCALAKSHYRPPSFVSLPAPIVSKEKVTESISKIRMSLRS